MQGTPLWAQNADENCDQLADHILENKEKNTLAYNSVLIYEIVYKKPELQNHVLFMQSLLHAIPVPVFYKDRDGFQPGC